MVAAAAAWQCTQKDSSFPLPRVHVAAAHSLVPAAVQFMDLQRRQFHTRQRRVLSQSSTQDEVISPCNNNHQIEVIRTGDIPHSAERDRQTQLDAGLSELRVNKPIYSLTLRRRTTYIYVALWRSLTLRRLMSYTYMEHPFLMFLDHTQRRSTVGRTPLDE